MSDQSVIKKGKVKEIFHKEDMQMPIEVLNALDRHLASYIHKLAKRCKANMGVYKRMDLNVLYITTGYDPNED
tara:strand:- start:40 stop:258 length:219 start_codon:yes stop_codon:yes gene_type:complete